MRTLKGGDNLARYFRSAGWLGLAAALLTLPLVLHAQTGSAEQRLARLERLVNSGTLLELLDRVERMQRELQQLRGEIELQGHTLSQLKQSQQEQYLDLEARIKSAESAAVQAPAIIEQPAVPALAVQTPAVVDTNPAVEQERYGKAFETLRAGDYETAIDSFTGFLRDYPQGAYSDNAQYWLGEAHYVMRDFEPAMREFQKVLDNYPGSQKVSGSLLKMGFIHEELGRKGEARRVLNDVIVQYPQTTAARLAEERLRRLQGG